MKYWKLIKKMYSKLPSFQYGKQCCAAVAVFIMLVLVAATSPNNSATAESAYKTATPSVALSIDQEIDNAIDILVLAQIKFVQETLSSPETAALFKAEEIAKKPSAVKLNMANVFPEGSDSSDVWNSYAGILYKDLILQDSEWLFAIYRYSTDKPQELAARLNWPDTAILGKYRQEEEGHDPDNPSSWTIPKFEKTNYTFTDGSGNSVNAYSNAKEILTLSSIYTFYQNQDPYNAMEAYAQNLWERSHEVSLSLGEVYYCDGELDQKIDESQEPEEMAVPQPVVPQPVNQEKHAEKSPPESEDADVQTRLESPQPTSLSEEGQRSEVNATPADASIPDDYSVQLEKQLTEILGSSKNMLTRQTNGAQSNIEQRCRGHVDLNAAVIISGIDGESGLIALDNTVSSGSTEGFHGWDEYNRAYADYLFNADWSEVYGLYPSDVAVINPLSASEVTRYLNGLPKGISSERRDIIEHALTSVGRIPYYWGGKPAAPNYDVNAFGTMVSPDYKGRALKGLDCSGWINWVYWSVTGTKPAAEGTGSLSNYGRSIGKEDLKPGDIMVRISDSSHVVMFLGWEADGSMKCIHESSTGSGNVIISTTSADGTAYRNLLD